MLNNCAKIATSKFYLHDREDKMQDAILHVLEKGIEDRSKAYVIMAMRNRIIDKLSMDSVWRLPIDDNASTYFDGISPGYDFSFVQENLLNHDEYSRFELLRELSEEDAFIFENTVKFGQKDVYKHLGWGEKRLRNRFKEIKNLLKQQLKELL